MTHPSSTKQLVEDVAAIYFGAIGATVKRGADIDDAAERTGTDQYLLQGRLASALQRLNPNLPQDTLEGVARTLAHPAHPTLIQNNHWFHGLLVDGVPVEYRLPAGQAGTGEALVGNAERCTAAVA